jgi:hypothetical protein
MCEPVPAVYRAAIGTFHEVGLASPPNEPDWRRYIDTYGDQLDVASITTPHLCYFAQATVKSDEVV